MLRSLSISEDSAYGIHGYTPPILEKLESREPPLEDGLAPRTYLTGNHPRVPCKLDNILRKERGISHTRPLLGRHSHPFYLCPTAIGQ
jgi:hypothetical protein